MANINTIIETFSEAIAADGDIKNWCNLHYGRDHKVFVNVDVRDLPGENDCPYVGLLPVNKRAGQAIREKEHGVGVFCCIHDESQVVTALNIIKYKGVERIEQFRKLTEDVIAASLPSRILLAEMEIEYDTITEFPFINGDMLIRLTEKVLIGADPLE